MEQNHTTNNQGPAKVFRQGAIAASIWRRTATTGHEYFDFSLSRSWRSKDGTKEGYSPNFYASNEAELTTVVQDACQWIAQHQTHLQTADSENGSVQGNAEAVRA